MRLDPPSAMLMIFTTFASWGSSCGDGLGLFGTFPHWSFRLLWPSSCDHLDPGLDHFLLVVGVSFLRFLHLVASGPIVFGPKSLLLLQP